MANLPTRAYLPMRPARTELVFALGDQEDRQNKCINSLGAGSNK